MTNLYLIAHKVRGEPAFDIAIKMKCPICEPIRQGLDNGEAYSGCEECNDELYWWIIPTSGHRAYPYRHWLVDDLYDGSDMDMPKPQTVLDSVDPPDNLPDHYEVRGEAVAKLTGLLERLGLKKSRPPLALRPL